MTDGIATAPPGAGHRPGSAPGPTVVVIGGGIAGLAAAWELTGGVGGPRPGGPSVVVLEADERLGGKLRSAPFAGTVVDVGPDGVLGRRPEAVDLCRELGLGDRLAPIGASGASVWVAGRPRPLPSALGLGVPTRFLPVARSGILGPAGALRLLVDVVAPRPDRRGPLGDRAIGPLVAHKLGHRVVDRLVDPLLGGIYAGGVEDASAAAVYPLLLDAAQRRGSLMKAVRHSATSRPPTPGPAAPGPAAAGPAAPGPAAAGPAAPGPALPGPAPADPARERAAGEPADEDDGPRPGDGPAPAFWAIDGGFDVLVGRLGTDLAARGVALRPGTPATGIRRSAAGGPAWTVHTAAGPIPADGLVIATPAAAAADLVAPHDGEAASLLRTIEYASVAVVTMALPTGTVPEQLHGTGMLVPLASRLPTALADHLAAGGPAGAGRPDSQFLVTACTFLSRKWPHLAAPGGDLVRASVGRFADRRFADLDDAELRTRVVAEVGALLGTDATPTDVLVTRWTDALPQYRVHHLLRVAGVAAAMERLPAVAVAGAAYGGVGVPACITSGRDAARDLTRRLGVPTEAG